MSWLGDLGKTALNVASVVPGPWQIPAIAGGAAARMGEHAYRRAHDDRYFRNSNALDVDPIMDAALQVAQIKMMPKKPWWDVDQYSAPIGPGMPGMP